MKLLKSIFIVQCECGQLIEQAYEQKPIRPNVMIACPSCKTTGSVELVYAPLAFGPGKPDGARGLVSSDQQPLIGEWQPAGQDIYLTKTLYKPDEERPGISFEEYISQYFGMKAASNENNS